jgi:hypothetical protein
MEKIWENYGNNCYFMGLNTMFNYQMIELKKLMFSREKKLGNPIAYACCFCRRVIEGKISEGNI